MPIRWNKEEEVDITRNVVEDWKCSLTVNFEDLPLPPKPDPNLDRYFAPPSKPSNDIIRQHLTHRHPSQPITIRKVMFSNPATIVFWSDGEKTIVKCSEREDFDPEKGLAMAIAKRVLGNKGNYYNTFVKYIPELGDKDDEQ